MGLFGVEMETSVVILAAGEGTRMSSSLPKAMQFLAGKTMLEHIKDTADAISSVQTIIAVSYTHLRAHET